MATTEITTRPLSDHALGHVAAQTFHTWEASVKGQTVERNYRLDHASADCPIAVEAAGIGATLLADAEGWPCSECFVDAPSADRGPNGNRSDSIDRPEGSATGGASRRDDSATDAQLRLLTALVRGSVASQPEWIDGRLSVEDAEGIVETTVRIASESKRQASDAIDRLHENKIRPIWEPLVVVAPSAAAEPAAPAPARTNRYAATCATCGGDVPAETGSLTKGPSGWQVRHVGTCPTAPAVEVEVLADVPAGHYAVASTGENDLSFYRVDRPTEGEHAGRVFVKLVVGGRPDQNVRRGQLASVLARIAEAGPAAAAQLYGQEIGRCSRCNRHLTDDESRRAGMGPECRRRA